MGSIDWGSDIDFLELPSERWNRSFSVYIRNHNNGTRFIAFFSCVTMPRTGHGKQTDIIDPPSILTRVYIYILNRRASLCKTSMFAVTHFQFGSSIMANVKNIAFNNAKEDGGGHCPSDRSPPIERNFNKRVFVSMRAVILVVWA